MPAAIPCDGTSRRILESVARHDETATDARIASWCKVDRSLVSHWRSGTAIPAWALGRIIRNLGDARPVLADLVAIVGQAVVALPGGAAEAQDALVAVLEAQGHLGNLAGETATALRPSSPGGAVLTKGERIRLRERIAPMLTLLITLDKALEEG